MDTRARRARFGALLFLGHVIAGLFFQAGFGAERILDAPGGPFVDGNWDAANESRPRWTVRVGTIFLERSRLKSQLFVFDSFPVAANLNADNFDFPVQGGIDVAALRRGTVADIDFRYFGIDQWSASQGPIQAGAEIIDATYASRLHSVEVNLRRNVTPKLTVLGGFRYLSFREHSSVARDVGIFPILQDFRTDTTNDLYGAQIGADAILWDRGGRLRIEGVVKAGVYAGVTSNQVDYGLSISGNVFANIVSVGASRDHTAFVGDLNFTAVYQLNEVWAVRVGYQLLWLDGIALATDQPPLVELSVNPTIQVDTSGSAFFHGALLGLERSW